MIQMAPYVPHLRGLFLPMLRSLASTRPVHLPATGRLGEPSSSPLSAESRRILANSTSIAGARIMLLHLLASRPAGSKAGVAMSKQTKFPSCWQRAAAPQRPPRWIARIELARHRVLRRQGRRAGRGIGEAAGALTLPTGPQFRDLYMVAHEDDDLLFMSPDVPESIRAGHTVRTVYLTAGDAGKTSAYWKDGREAGIREAYALMAGVDNSWTESVDTVQGKPAYRFTLVGNQRVSVVFLRLPNGGSGDGFPPPRAIPTVTARVTRA